MFLNVAGDHTPLPICEAASHGTFAARSRCIQTNKFMRQDDAECFKIRAAIGACSLDQPLELERSVRQCRIIEEKPRNQRCRPDICFMIRRHHCGIKIEIHDAGKNAWFLPLVIQLTGRHERQLSPHVSQLRSGQTIDKRLPLASYALVIYRKKVKWGAKAKLYLFRSGSLHD